MSLIWEDSKGGTGKNFKKMERELLEAINNGNKTEEEISQMRKELISVCPCENTLEKERYPDSDMKTKINYKCLLCEYSEETVEEDMERIVNIKQPYSEELFNEMQEDFNRMKSEGIQDDEIKKQLEERY